MKTQIVLTEERVLTFLALPAIQEQIDEQTKLAIKSKVLKLVDFTLYNRKELKASGASSGIQDLFLPSDVESQGIRNFTNAKLPDFSYMVVAGVKIGVKASSSSSDPAHITDYSSLRSGFPAALSNGKLVISQNDKPVIEVEIFNATSQGSALSTFGNDDMYALTQLKLIRPAIPFNWQIKFADGETVISSATYVHLEVSLVGWLTKLK